MDTDKSVVKARWAKEEKWGTSVIVPTIKNKNNKNKNESRKNF